MPLVLKAADRCRLLIYWSRLQLDAADFDILSHLERAVAFIDDVSGLEGGRVLVHCHRGVSRSGTIVIAYLMSRFRLRYGVRACVFASGGGDRGCDKKERRRWRLGGGVLWHHSLVVERLRCQSQTSPRLACAGERRRWHTREPAGQRWVQTEGFGSSLDDGRPDCAAKRVAQEPSHHEAIQ